MSWFHVALGAGAAGRRLRRLRGTGKRRQPGRYKRAQAAFSRRRGMARRRRR